MYKYNTSIQNQPPVTPAMRVLSQLASPYEYTSTHGDVMRARKAAEMADYNVEGDRLNADYDWAQQSAENAAISRGLQMMARDKEQRDSLRNSRMSSMQGMANSVLGGLFG